MPVWKFQIFFKDGDQGWSELYWLNSPSTTPTGAKLNADAFIRARAELLAGEPSLEIDAYRLSVPRPSTGDFIKQTKLFGVVGNNRSAPAGAPNDMDRDNTVNIEFRSEASAAHVVKGFRGCPSLWIKGSNRLKHGVSANAKFTAAMAAFADHVARPNGNRPLAIKTYLLTGNPQKNITAITTNDAGRYVLTSVAHGFAVGQRVIWQEARGLGLRKAGGVTRVVAITTDTFTIKKKKCDPCAIDPENLGKVRNYQETFLNVESVDAVGWGNKKVGKPFDVRPARPHKACCK